MWRGCVFDWRVLEGQIQPCAQTQNDSDDEACWKLTVMLWYGQGKRRWKSAKKKKKKISRGILVLSQPKAKIEICQTNYGCEDVATLAPHVANWRRYRWVMWEILNVHAKYDDTHFDNATSANMVSNLSARHAWRTAWLTAYKTDSCQAGIGGGNISIRVM